jgi:hypothetical protein
MSKRKIIVFILITVSLIILCYIVIDLSKIGILRSFQQERKASAIGIKYVPPETFDIENNFGVCITSGKNCSVIFPRKIDKITLYTCSNYSSIKFYETSGTGNILGFIAKKGELYYSPDIIVWNTKQGQQELFQSNYIAAFSLSADNSEIAFISENDKGCYLFKINIHTGKIIQSKHEGFNLFDVPIWITSNCLIVSHSKYGIIKYNFDTQDYNVLISGSYEEPIEYKNQYLIFRNSVNDEYFISRLDGSEISFLFKNQYVDSCLRISPDDKFMACSSVYPGAKIEDDSIPIKKCHLVLLFL